jgi:hypothetical protein
MARGASKAAIGRDLGINANLLQSQIDEIRFGAPGSVAPCHEIPSAKKPAEDGVLMFFLQNGTPPPLRRS